MFRGNRMKKVLIFLVFLISGCTSNSFLDYYNDEQIPLDGIIPCDIKEIRLIETQEPEEKIKKYKKQGFVVLGFSEFEGEWEPRYRAIELAKEKKACLVILSSSLTQTEEREFTVPIPQAGYSHHSGQVGNISYSGNTASVSTAYVNQRYHVKYFNQEAVFLGKKNGYTK